MNEVIIPPNALEIIQAVLSESEEVKHLCIDFIETTESSQITEKFNQYLQRLDQYIAFTELFPYRWAGKDPMKYNAVLP